jgi:hypothetical protein
MSHFAEIEWDNDTHKKGIVKRILVAEQDFINSGIVGDSFNWVQTSYNNNFRKNYAGIGHTYDKERDAFIEPKPIDSWILDEKTCAWKRPVAMDTIPDFDEEKEYILSPDGGTWTEASHEEMRFPLPDKDN